jgi:hypothetical protein
MPIYECDPWREQYFASVECPPDVHIPTDDIDAHRFHPRHHWIYDKLLIARSQGLDCGPHDRAPPSFPVFSKPIVNLKGMGIGSRVLRDEADYVAHREPGHFWMTLLTGEHVSSDIAVVAGRAVWFRHTRGMPGHGGTFDHWVIQAAANAGLENYCADWIRHHLGDYTGMLNVETIGGRIIEMHLRFSDQWPDLYGDGWLEAVVRLYQRGAWEFADRGRTDGYSVILFGPHGRTYPYPTPGLLFAYRETPGIKSVQITFSEGRLPSSHNMPPGGFRLAVINTEYFEAGLRLRSLMAADFSLE